MRPEEGGRDVPPSGPRYSTVAKFEAQANKDWSANAWSVVVIPAEAPNAELIQAATVRFLADDVHPGVKLWMQPGCIFALFEGTRKVAEVTVLSDE